MVLKELLFSQFLLLGGCGGLARTEYFTISTVGRVWWS